MDALFLLYALTRGSKGGSKGTNFGGSSAVDIMH